MNSETSEAINFLPTTVSDDGMHVTVNFVTDAGELRSMRMPSPLNAMLIADLQNADAKAKDIYRGENRESASGMLRLTVRQPKTIAATRNALDDSVVIVFDQGLPTEMAFQLPPSGDLRLAQVLLEQMKQRPDARPRN